MANASAKQFNNNERHGKQRGSGRTAYLIEANGSQFHFCAFHIPDGVDDVEIGGKTICTLFSSEC